MKRPGGTPWSGPKEITITHMGTCGIAAGARDVMALLSRTEQEGFPGSAAAVPPVRPGTMLTLTDNRRNIVTAVNRRTRPRHRRSM